MDNSEKLATHGKQYEDKTQRNMRWTPLCSKKYKQRKYDTRATPSKDESNKK